MMRVEEVTTLDGLKAHRDAWTELLDQSDVRVIFLTPEWVIAWWSELGGDHAGGDLSLWVLLVWDGPRLVGVAPLMRRAVRRFGLQLRRLEFVGGGMGDYGDVVLGKDPDRVLDAIARHLVEAGGWDLGILDDVSGFAGLPARFAQALSARRIRVRATSGELCPHVTIAGAWETFLDDSFTRRARGGRRRKELRRLERLLADRGKVTCRVVRGLRDDPDCFEKMARIQREGPTERALFDVPAYRRFLERLARDTIEKDWLRISVLQVDDEWIAYYFGFHYANRYGLYNTAFRSAFADCSPGSLLMVQVLKHAFDEGLAEVDFMRGAEDFKFHWSNGSRTNTRMVFYPDTIRGRVIHELYCDVWPRLRGLKTPSQAIEAPVVAGRAPAEAGTQAL